MSYRLHDVLALVPLNDEGKIVLQQAKYLQDVLGVRIYVLHVIPPVSPFLRLFKPRQIRAKEHEAVKKLTQFVKDFFGGEIPNSVIIDVLQGPLAPTIIRHVDKENFLFIILKPSPGETGAESTPDQKAADEIIRQVNCPVLTINQEATKHGIRNILIPIDISEGTKKRLLWGSFFAQKTHARVQIVSALNIDMEEKKSLAYRNAEKIKTMLQERGIECEVTILKVSGKVKHEVVLSYIEENKPDFVIIRKRQVASSFRKNIGPFAQEIIHGSNVPVFTVGQAQKDIEQILS